MNNSQSLDPSHFSSVRRQDRAVTDEQWMCEFIQRVPYATVATTVNNQPYINPLLLAYDSDEHAVYFHTSRLGRIFNNIQQCPHVCINVCEMGELLPAPTAAGFGLTYASVDIFGIAELVTDEQQVMHALYLLLVKYFPDHTPGEDYRMIMPEEVARTAVYRVHISCWTGKAHR